MKKLLFIALMAMGANAQTATGEHATAVGAGSQATGKRTSAFGDLARATGDYSTAVGRFSASRGESSTAIGASSEANAKGSTALGAGSFSSGLGSTAIGQGSQATTNGAIALGQGATANSGNAVQIGAGTNSTSNTVNFGNGMKLTNVNNGAVNATSKEAVNGSQLHATNQSISNLTTIVNTKVSQTEFNNLSYSVSVNTNDITDLQNTKVDKAQVQLDIAQAKAEANAYTDTKVGALETKVNTEVTRLDKRIDATNTTVENNKVEAAKATAKVQSNLDIESAARKKADEEIYGSISKTNANLDKEIATRKLEVARLDNRIDNVINYVGNEFKAVNNRIEGLGAMTVALSTAATSSVYNPNKPTNVNFATGYYGRAGALALGVSHFLSSNTKLSVNYAAGSFTKNAVGLGVGFCF